MIGEIHTERLVLHPIDVATAGRIVTGEMGGLRCGTGWPMDKTVEALEFEIDRGSSPVRWLFLLGGVVIGDLGWKGGPGPDGTAEIGYAVAEAYRGCGYATEAVTGFVRWARTQDGVACVVARTLADNTESRQVLHKSGFVIEREEDQSVYWRCETAAS